MAKIKKVAKYQNAPKPVKPSKSAGMTMKELKMKYSDVDTGRAGDVRGTEMNAYAPKKELKKYNDTYNAFERKFGNKPAKDKKGGIVKKAKTGTSLGMKSVKAGVDKNPGVTRADIIVAGQGKAKKGKMVKKAQDGYKGSKMANDWYKDQKPKAPMQNPKFKMDLEKSKADTIKLNPPAPRKGGKLIIPKVAKKGTKMTKKCAYGCK